MTITDGWGWRSDCLDSFAFVPCTPAICEFINVEIWINTELAKKKKRLDKDMLRYTSSRTDEQELRGPIKQIT